MTDLPVDSYFRLLSSDWLDDVIIDRYLELVATYGNLIGKKCLAFSTHILDLCADHGYDKYVAHYKTALEESELIFFPINVPGHWVLYIFVQKANILEFYDSGGGSPRKLSALKNFLKCFNILEYEVDKKNVVYQKDGFNCGVFLCIFARYRITGGEFTKIPAKNFKEERYKILLELSVRELLYRYIMQKENYEDSSSDSNVRDSDYEVDDQNYYKKIIMNVCGNNEENFEILTDELAYFKDGLNNRADKEGIILQITLGSNHRSVGLLDLLYCSVRFKLRGWEWADYIYDGSESRSNHQTIIQMFGEDRAEAIEQLNDLLSVMIVRKTLVPVHVLEEYEDYNSFYDELELIELKKEFPKEKIQKKAPIKEEDNLLPENRTCSEKNIKYSYDIDGLKGAIHLSKAHQFCKAKIFLNKKVNTFIKPQNKYFYYIHNGRFIRNTELFHVHLGIMEVNSIVFNFYGVTNLKSQQDILQKEFIDNLENTIQRFSTSKCRDMHNVFLANARVPKNRKIDHITEKADNTVEKILSIETEDLWRALRSNNFIYHHMPTIYVECFGMKADLHSNSLDRCYELLDNIDGLEHIDFLEHDICMMTSPKNISENIIVFQKIPDYIRKNAGHGKFSLFFSNTAEHVNKRTVIHKPQYFKIRKDGITKFNLYNGLYKALMPGKIGKLKGAHLIVHQLRDTLDDLLKRKKKVYKDRIEFTTLRANIENCKDRSFPYRNEIACEVSLGSNNILRLKRKMANTFYLYDTNTLLDYILEFLNAFEAFLTVKNIDITLDNFIKGVICELILFETFLKGSLNRHSVNTANYNKILKRLFRKDKIPKYNIDFIIKKILKKMKRHRIFESIKKTIDYNMVERPALSDIKILYNIISKKSVNNEIKGGIVQVLKLSVDQCTKSSGDSMHVIEWVTRLTDMLSTRKSWIVVKAPELRYAQVVIAISPDKKYFIHQIFLEYLQTLRPKELVKLAWKFSSQSLEIIYTQLSAEKSKDGFKMIEFRNSLEKRLNQFIDLSKRRSWSDVDYAKILFGLRDGNNSVVSAFRDIRLAFFGFVELEKFKSARKNLNQIMAGSSRRKEKIIECLNSSDFSNITLEEWQREIENENSISLDDEILREVYDWATINGKPFRIKKITDLVDNKIENPQKRIHKFIEDTEKVEDVSNHTDESRVQQEDMHVSDKQVDNAYMFLDGVCFGKVVEKMNVLESAIEKLKIDSDKLGSAQYNTIYSRKEKYSQTELSEFNFWLQEQKYLFRQNTLIQPTPVSQPVLEVNPEKNLKFTEEYIIKMRKTFKDEPFTYTMVKRLLFNKATSEEQLIWKGEFEKLVTGEIFTKPNPKRNAYIFNE